MNGSMWSMVCSGVSTCALGNTTDLRKPMVVSALDLRWQERQLGWFGGVPLSWQKRFCTDSVEGVACRFSAGGGDGAFCSTPAGRCWMGAVIASPHLLLPSPGSFLSLSLRWTVCGKDTS